MSTHFQVTAALLVMIIPSVTSTNLYQTYDRLICLSVVNSTYYDLISQNPSYFAPGSINSRILLTYPGCNALCGSKWGAYPDSGSRVIDWIVPGVILIANFHFVPIRFKRYASLAHLLGDPIDTMLRLLYLVEEWVVNVRIAEVKSLPPIPLATVLSAAGRLLDPETQCSLSPSITRWLSSRTKSISEARYALLTETAIKLRQLRLHDTRRSSFAIFLYFFQFVMVFVYKVGGSPNPSGGRVSPAMLLSWLVPVVLLSNAIGDYGSWEYSQHVIVNFLEEVYKEDRCAMIPTRVPAAIYRKSNSKWQNFISNFTELSCTGTIRHSRRRRQPTLPSRRRKLLLLLIALFPISLACATAFRVDYTAPTYFSCRAATTLSSFAAWLLSWILTNLLSAAGQRRTRRLNVIWLLIFLKDVIIGLTILLVIFLSTAGLFNSCFRVSGVLIRGNSRAVVDLDPTSLYPHNNYNIYPWTVGIGLFLQLMTVLVLRGWVMRKGFEAIWWRVPNVGEGGEQGDGRDGNDRLCRNEQPQRREEMSRFEMRNGVSVSLSVEEISRDE